MSPELEAYVRAQLSAHWRGCEFLSIRDGQRMPDAALTICGERPLRLPDCACILIAPPRRGPKVRAIGRCVIELSAPITGAQLWEQAKSLVERSLTGTT
jgi:hypothetical protein